MADINLHNKIAGMSLNCFKTLPKSVFPKDNEWTVLSCIVQQSGTNFKVVSLGTGSKCIGENKMCPNGTILNDSHAEIICRRSFLKYIYNQLNSTDSIYEFNQKTNKFVLKNNIKFHFFTTHVPCGDAAIFPKQNEENYGEILNEDEETKIKKPKYDDIFRTGAKCLENDEKFDSKESGCNYHALGAIRRKPGRGDPTLSVSCSDKISKWCHIGIQGALLSLLLEKPIYLSSFTVVKNTPFCESAFQRATYERFGNIELHNENYNRYHLEVCQVKDEICFEYCKNEVRNKASPISVSWVKGQLEIAVEGRKQGVTKKNINKESGRLKICKLELFKLFLNVVRTHKIDQLYELKDPLTYKNVKLLATEYQDVWKRLRQSFKVWTNKNDALLNFTIE